MGSEFTRQRAPAAKDPSSSAIQRQPSPLVVNRPGDRYEQEADRVADAVVNGRGQAATFSLSAVPIARVQREDAPKEKTDEEKYKEAGAKLKDGFLATPLGKDLQERVKQDKLVKGATEAGKSFIATLPGKIITGAAAAGAVATLAALHKELPAQIPEIPLDVLTPGLSVEITYKGPVDKPTEAMITFKFAEQAPKGGGDGERKPALTRAEKQRAENAVVAADQAKSRAGMSYPPGSPEDLQQKADEEAAKRALAKYAPGPDLDAMVKKYPWLQAPQPKSGLQLEMPKPSFGYKPASLLGDEYKLKLPGEKKKKEDEPALQRKATGDATVDAAPPVVRDVLQSPGQPLDAGARAFMEARFGHDFGQVRVHTDAKAAESARAVQARAYTVGRDVVFSDGHYAPHSREGSQLLAHELVHVIQQERGGASPPPLRGGMLEQDADAAASAFVAGRGPIHVGRASAPGLARQPLIGSLGPNTNRQPRSLTKSLNVQELRYAEVEEEIELIQEWLDAHQFTPDTNRLLLELEGLQVRRLQIQELRKERQEAERRKQEKIQERRRKRLENVSDERLDEKIDEAREEIKGIPESEAGGVPETLKQLEQERARRRDVGHPERQDLLPKLPWYQRHQLEALDENTRGWTKEERGLARDLLWQWFELRNQGHAPHDVEEQIRQRLKTQYEQWLRAIDKQIQDKCTENPPGWSENVKGMLSSGHEPCEPWFGEGRHGIRHGPSELRQFESTMRVTTSDIPYDNVFGWVREYRNLTNPDQQKLKQQVQIVLSGIVAAAAARVQTPSRPSPKIAAPALTPPTSPLQKQLPPGSAGAKVGDIISPPAKLGLGPQRVAAVLPEGELLKPVTRMPPANRALPGATPPVASAPVKPLTPTLTAPTVPAPPVPRQVLHGEMPPAQKQLPPGPAITPRTTPPTAREAAASFQAKCSKCDQSATTLDGLEDIFRRTMSGKRTVTPRPGRYLPSHTRGAAGELDAIRAAQLDPAVTQIRVVPPQGGRGAQRTPDLEVDVQLPDGSIVTKTGAREIRTVTGGRRGYQPHGSRQGIVADADAIANAIRTKIFPSGKPSQLTGGGDQVIQVRRGGPNVDATLEAAVNQLNPRLVGARFLRELHFHLPGGRVVRYVRAPNGAFVAAP